jgi:hypothetical protein
LITGTHIFIGADKMGNLCVIDGDAMRQPGNSSIISASEGSIFNFAVWSSGDGARVYTQGGLEPVKCFQVTGIGVNPDPVSTTSGTGSEVTLWAVVTDLAYFDIDADGFLLRELAPGLSVDDVRRATAARMRVASDVREMQF